MRVESEDRIPNLTTQRVDVVPLGPPGRGGGGRGGGVLGRVLNSTRKNIYFLHQAKTGVIIITL